MPPLRQPPPRRRRGRHTFQSCRRTGPLAFGLWRRSSPCRSQCFAKSRQESRLYFPALAGTLTAEIRSKRVGTPYRPSLQSTAAARIRFESNRTELSNSSCFFASILPELITLCSRLRRLYFSPRRYHCRTYWRPLQRRVRQPRSSESTCLAQPRGRRTCASSTVDMM
jgi:hypothetical protein